MNDNQLWAQGRLLQLALPLEVKPGASAAQRSATKGNLLLILPKEDPAAKAIDQSCWRSVQNRISHVAYKPHARVLTAQLLSKPYFDFCSCPQAQFEHVGGPE